MPPRRYAKRTKRSSMYRRRTGGRSVTAKLSVNPSSAGRTMAQNRRGYTRALTGFPNEMRVVLPYTDMRLNPVVATKWGVDTVYNLNSVFDPENSGVGHQPRGFDQWAANYSRYRVNKVTIAYTLRQRAAHGIHGYIVVNNDSGSLENNNEVAEYTTAIRLGGTSANVKPLQGKKVFWPHKVLGVSWAQYVANEDTAGLVTANPAEVLYLHLIAQQIDETTLSETEHEIVLFYDVTFFDRKNIAAS